MNLNSRTRYIEHFVTDRDRIAEDADVLAHPLVELVVTGDSHIDVVIGAVVQLIGIL